MSTQPGLVSNPHVQAALRQIGIEKPTWQTVIAFASRETAIPRQKIWGTWTKLETWPSFSPLYAQTRWLGQPGWEVGATFEQALNLGFPLGENRSREEVGAIEPGERVSWWKDERGIKSNHIWVFEDVPGSGTRITNVEVFHGLIMGLLKPLVAGRWQRLFEVTVDGLVTLAQE
jgi:hypothetical protein